MLRTRLNRTLEDISAASNDRRVTILNVLTTAEAEGWLHELLTTAREERKQNAQFTADIDAILNAQPSPVKIQSVAGFTLNELLCLILVIVVGFWSVIMFGLPALLSFVGVVIAWLSSSFAQSRRSFRFVEKADRMFDKILHSQLGLVALTAILICFLVATLFIGRLHADSRLDGTIDLDLRTDKDSSASHTELSPGEPIFLGTGLFRPREISVLREGYSDLTLRVFPWQNRKIKSEDFRHEIYSIIVPRGIPWSTIGINSPWKLTVKIADPSSNKSNKPPVEFTIEKYFGEPVLLGPCRITDQPVLPTGPIPNIALTRLNESLAPGHTRSVQVGDQEIQLRRVIEKDLRLREGQVVHVQLQQWFKPADSSVPFEFSDINLNPENCFRMQFTCTEPESLHFASVHTIETKHRITP